ncbi:hypothetical protein D9M72_603060 [compost metagenome]
MVASLEKLSEGLVLAQGQLRRQAVVPFVARQRGLPIGGLPVLAEVEQRIGGKRNAWRRIEKGGLHGLRSTFVLATRTGLSSRTTGKIAQSVA